MKIARREENLWVYYRFEIDLRLIWRLEIVGLEKYYMLLDERGNRWNLLIRYYLFRSGDSNSFREKLLFCCKRAKVKIVCFSFSNIQYTICVIYSKKKMEDLFMRNIFFLDINLKKPLQ